MSRQLVYEHFADTSDLLACVMQHLFERAHAATARIVSAAAPDDRGSVVREAYEVYLALPRAQRRALRALAADSDPGFPELDRARNLMRHETLSLWVPYVRRRTGLSEPKARALAWMFTTAAWGITDLVEDGTLSQEEATALLTDLVARTVPVAEKPGSRRSLRGAVAARGRGRQS